MDFPLLALIVVGFLFFGWLRTEIVGEREIKRWAERRNLALLESERLYDSVDAFAASRELRHQLWLGHYALYKVRVHLRDDGSAPHSGYVLVPFDSAWSSEAQFTEHWLGPRPGGALSTPRPPIASLLESEPLDADILYEIARRLDAISADPEAMRAFDANGDGFVDREEWEQARRMIEAEVRGDAPPIEEPEVRDPTPIIEEPDPPQDDDGYLW